MSQDVASSLSKIARHMERLQELQRVESDAMAAIAGYMGEIAVIASSGTHAVQVMPGVMQQQAPQTVFRQASLQEQPVGLQELPEAASPERKPHSPEVASKASGAKRKQPSGRAPPLPAAARARGPSEVPERRREAEGHADHIRRLHTRVVSGATDPITAASFVAQAGPPHGDTVDGMLACFEDLESPHRISQAERAFLSCLLSHSPSNSIVDGVAHRLQLLSTGTRGTEGLCDEAHHLGAVTSTLCLLADRTDVAASTAHDAFCQLAACLRDAERQKPPAPPRSLPRARLAASCLLGMVTSAPAVLPADALWVFAAGSTVSNLLTVLRAAGAEQADLAPLANLQQHLPCGMHDAHSIAMKRLLETPATASTADLMTVALHATTAGHEWCLAAAREEAVVSATQSAGEGVTERCRRRNSLVLQALLLLHASLDPALPEEGRKALVASAGELAQQDVSEADSGPSLKFLAVAAAVHGSRASSARQLSAGSSVVAALKEVGGAAPVGGQQEKERQQPVAWVSQLAAAVAS